MESDSPKGEERFYLECHDPRLCGHFGIVRAQLGRDAFRFELAGDPPETVQIKFKAGRARYSELKRILAIIMSEHILTVEPER